MKRRGGRNEYFTYWRHGKFDGSDDHQTEKRRT